MRVQAGNGAERCNTLSCSHVALLRARSATVASKVTGRVSEVLIEEGQHVDAGQVLARLDDTAQLVIDTTRAGAAAQAASGGRGRCRS